MSTPVTAEPPADPHTLPGWIRPGLIAATLFVGGCGGALVWWRVSAREPSATEWMLLLSGLTLALLLAGLIGHTWIAKRGGIRADMPPAAPAPPAGAAASPARVPHLAILATALRSPHGASPEQLAAAIADNRARPDLDRELVDGDGVPVMCARCPDAADAALRDDVTDWLAAHGGAAADFSDEQWRALTLATYVVAELVGRAAIEWIVRDGAVPLLRVLPLLPPDWAAGQREAAAAWLRHTAAQAGWRGEIGAAVCDADPAAGVAQLARLAAADGTSCVTLLVATASHVGAATVARWAAARTLFTSAQPQGSIPGEGAAALLLGGAAPAEAYDGQAVALLAPLEEAQAEVAQAEVAQAEDAPDARRRGAGRVLARLVGRTLADAGVDAGDVAMIVADTGHRSRPVYELMEYAATALRQLDGREDVVRVGAGGGSCGIVPFVTALALGAHYAGARQAPVLCLANDTPGRRIAALVRPVA